MKRIITAFVLLACILPTIAQNSWEIKDKKLNSLQVGAVFMSIPTDLMRVNPVGMQAGYTRTLELGNKGLYLETGLSMQYARVRADFDKKESPKRLNSNLLIGRVPVLVGYKWDLEHDTALRLHAGAFAQYRLAEDATIHSYELNKDIDFNAFWNKTFGYGLIVGAQYNFDSQWFGGADFTYNLNCISDDFTPTILLSTDGVKPYAIELHIGYRF